MRSENELEILATITDVSDYSRHVGEPSTIGFETFELERSQR